jgi:acyl dehydratase
VIAVPAPGTPLPPLEKPRFTAAHVVRWMAAQQNWDRIHFDQAFCRDMARLEAPVINGALKQHLIIQFLQRALPGAWPWRVDYQFTGPDFVGQKLQVRGTTGASRTAGGNTFLEVDVVVFNVDKGEVTTRGHATVILPSGSQPVLDALNVEAPDDLELPLAPVPADPATPAVFAKRLGQELDRRESRYGIDLSRLRLFAEAVMDLDPVHFDPDAASPWGGVVAPPLFPLHGLEALPGSFPLSEAPDAQGREGVNEVGRDFAAQFGLRAAGGMNAGNRVQVHSLAGLGERIAARSMLASIRKRSGPRGGEMVFVESLNHYTTTEGRPLVTERQTMVVRLLDSGFAQSPLGSR